jgi:hypothetical protein
MLNERRIRNVKSFHAFDLAPKTGRVPDGALLHFHPAHWVCAGGYGRAMDMDHATILRGIENTNLRVLVVHEFAFNIQSPHTVFPPDYGCQISM